MLHDQEREPRQRLVPCGRQIDVFATALDKAFENNDCMIVILSCQTKNSFYESSQRLIQLRGHTEKFQKEKLITRSALLAIKSDTNNASTEITRYIQGLTKATCPQEAASIVCVACNGLWMLRKAGGAVGWHRLKSDDPAQRLACFVAVVSSTIAEAHLERTGVDRDETLARGIGLYFPTQDEWEIEPALG